MSDTTDPPPSEAECKQTGSDPNAKSLALMCARRIEILDVQGIDISSANSSFLTHNLYVSKYACPTAFPIDSITTGYVA